jgi:glycosyltransferase involved in cell wall biosynthesis/RimJ/RimL family protein N-acetyltransferase
MYKVLIRPLRIEDASKSFRWRNDPEVWQYTGSRPDMIITEEAERKWMSEKLSEKNSARFAITVDDQYIGNIQLTDISEKNKGQYHIFIGEKLFWGKGIASLATAQIIRVAKEKLNLRELYLIVNPEHEAAVKLYNKCGFVKINEETRMEMNLSALKPPLTSVFVMTYNHENYIDQALRGILMQKTNFDFEIVVGEDCSTDKTREIVQEYSDKFPGKFKLLLHNKNIGAMANQTAVLKSCTGKYIAFCEGDDYWTDPDKLKKQVDFLEANPDYSMCFTDRMIVNSNNTVIKDTSVPVNLKKHLEAKDIIGAYTPPTQTVVFRKSYLETDPCILESLKKVYNGDTFLFSYLATMGKVGYIDLISAAYRINDSGVYNNLDYYNRLKNRLNTFQTFQKSVPIEFHRYIYRDLKVTLQRLFVISWRSLKFLSGINFACSLFLIDLKTKDISTIRAIKLLLKSILNKEYIITD